MTPLYSELESAAMRVDDFDFDLPEQLIAKRPLEKRDGARLLCLPDSDGPLMDRHISDLVSLVRPGDLWVINDTRVIPARLIGQKPSGGKVEILLLEPAGEDHCWLAWGRSNKPLKAGSVVEIGEGFRAEVVKRDGKEIEVRLHAEDVAAAIEQFGHMPLPPYIDRPDSAADRERYQTVFADQAGAVAAPTAGLHLTESLMQQMEAAGATFVRVTLHVGPGTFQPVQVDDVQAHKMHAESYMISDASAGLIRRAKAEGRRVVAVGTTSLRTLEAASQHGALEAGSGRTDIFIYPGYHFRTVDALLTNFHLPRSTLIMLVAALAGREPVMAAYAHAIDHNYRFYSYGDAMFVPGVSA